MKNIILITILFFALLSCKAQSPIVSLDAKRHKTVDGAYFKDINNELNKFSGTWIFSNGNTIFTVSLEKKTQIQVNNDYRDILVGEYKYIENGVEIINTLPILNQTPEDVKNHNIGGGSIITNNRVVICDDCTPDERRLKLYFNDSERAYLSVSIVLRYIQDAELGESAKMTATIVSNGGGMIPNANSPTATRVPYGEYLMEKQL